MHPCPPREAVAFAHLEKKRLESIAQAEHGPTERAPSGMHASCDVRRACAAWRGRAHGGGRGRPAARKGMCPGGARANFGRSAHTGSWRAVAVRPAEEKHGATRALAIAVQAGRAISLAIPHLARDRASPCAVPRSTGESRKRRISADQIWLKPSISIRSYAVLENTHRSPRPDAAPGAEPAHL